MLFLKVMEKIPTFSLEQLFPNLKVEIVRTSFQTFPFFNYIMISFLLIIPNHFLVAYSLRLPLFLFLFFIVLIWSPFSILLFILLILVFLQLTLQLFLYQLNWLFLFLIQLLSKHQQSYLDGFFLHLFILAINCFIIPAALLPTYPILLLSLNC